MKKRSVDTGAFFIYSKYPEQKKRYLPILWEKDSFLETILRMG